MVALAPDMGSKVGRRKLYLLDTMTLPIFLLTEGSPANFMGGTETTFKARARLGIGGWRLLEASGIQPEMCHMNEGHAAFVVLERALSFMKKNNTDI